MKLMKKILLTTIVSFFASIHFINGQDQNANLQKYWAYRDRLRQKFILVDQNVEYFGTNIPASSIDLTSKSIDWGDANSGMSHYLSVLATELWLLKNNEQDYSQTLKELYYAMHAMERMDVYSESSLRGKANLGNFVDEPVDRNGFHIRDDVSEGFWNNYKSHFMSGNTVEKMTSVFFGDPLDSDWPNSDWPDSDWPHSNWPHSNWSDSDWPHSNWPQLDWPQLDQHISDQHYSG